MFRGPQFSYLLRLFLDALLLFLLFLFSVKVTAYLQQGTPVVLPQRLFFISLLLWYFSARVFHFYTSVTLFSFSQEMTIFLRLLSLHLLLFVFVLFLLIKAPQSYRDLVWVYHAALLVRSRSPNISLGFSFHLSENSIAMYERYWLLAPRIYRPTCIGRDDSSITWSML